MIYRSQRAVQNVLSISVDEQRIASSLSRISFATVISDGRLRQIEGGVSNVESVRLATAL